MQYNDFLSYVTNALSCYGSEIDSAIDYMDKCRCPLNMASEKITNIIEDAIRDYCYDNDIDYYNFNYEEAFDATIEDIFFDAIEEIDRNEFSDDDDEY